MTTLVIMLVTAITMIVLRHTVKARLDSRTMEQKREFSRRVESVKTISGT